MSSTTTTNFTLGTLLDLVGQTTQPLPGAKGDSVFDAFLQKKQENDRSDDSESLAADRSSNGSTSIHNGSDYDDQRDNGTLAAPQGSQVKDRGAEKPIGAEKAEKKEDRLDEVAEQELANVVNAQELAAAAGWKAPIAAVQNETASGNEAEFVQAGKEATNIAAGKGQVRQPATAEAQSVATIEVKPTTSTEGASEQGQPQKGIPKSHGETADATAPNVQRDDQERVESTHSAANTDVSVPEGQPTGDAFTNVTSDSTTDVAQAQRRDSGDDQGSPGGDATADLAQASVDQLTTSSDANTPAMLAASVPVSPVPDSPANKGAEGTASAITGAAPRRSRLPSDLLAPNAGPVTRRGMVEMDTARLLNRVARALSAAQSHDGEVRLRLSPPELGSLKVEIRVQDGALVAHLEAETDVAKAAIVDSLPVLRERLAEQGMRIERFDVDLMQRQMSGFANQSDQHQPNQQPGASRVALPARRTAEATAVPAIPVRASVPTAGGLNVIV